MITNTDISTFDVIEITNEMPINRMGGVGSVIENLVSGFQSSGIKALWFLTDHNYRQNEIDKILSEFSNVAIGSYDDLIHFSAPIIHLHTYNFNYQPINHLSSKKVIFTIHSLLICEAHSNNVDLSWSIKQQENLISACDEVVLISQAELDNYYKFGYQNLNSNVSIIYNGLKDLKRFNNRRKNGLIGFCGRLVPRKRPEYVQMILQEKEFDKFSAMIAGRGFSAYARDLLLDLEIQDRVQYIGWCGGARLESFYDSIDLLVIPSVYEPFGMVALEAVTRGIPIVCTRVGGLVELLGDYAFYSENDTYESFREAMKLWLKADSETIKSVTNGALERYYKNFTDMQMAARYMNLFDCLNEQPRCKF